MNASRRTSKKILLLILIALVAVAGYFLWPRGSDGGAENGQNAGGQTQQRGKGGRRNMPLAPVQAATAETQSVPQYFSGLGTVTAANTVTVRRKDNRLRRASCWRRSIHVLFRSRSPRRRDNWRAIKRPSPTPGAIWRAMKNWRKPTWFRSRSWIHSVHW